MTVLVVVFVVDEDEEVFVDEVAFVKKDVFVLDEEEDVLVEVVVLLVVVGNSPEHM